MATIQIDIPNGVLTRVTSGICEKFNYQDTVNGQPNPETKAQFSKRMVALVVKDWVTELELAKVDVDLSRTHNITKSSEQARIIGELNIT